MGPVVTYDTRARAYTVRLRAGRVHRTVRFDPVNLVDLDEAGNVLSVEVLSPERARIEDLASEFGFEDQLPAIQKAIEKEVPLIRTGGATSWQIGNAAVQPVKGKPEESTPGSQVAQEIDLIASR